MSRARIENIYYNETLLLKLLDCVCVCEWSLALAIMCERAKKREKAAGLCVGWLLAKDLFLYRRVVRCYNDGTNDNNNRNTNNINKNTLARSKKEEEERRKKC